MRSIQDWQKEFAEAANTKYPHNATWSQEDRVLAIVRQLADVSEALHKETGKLKGGSPDDKSVDHRIATLLVDILLLCEMRKLDPEPEMQKVLDWFLDAESKRSNEK